ncbi:hypothetical protein [Streptomyces sp. NBC_01262]|uniref:hypothetical protein n=1 Tax=Streptomyces sp. NBC_01262 TaxID=2903803 RepID=UPI002E369A1C|nr:hypothetical protein [Streptomyces sp. NBC_01262]
MAEEPHVLPDIEIRRWKLQLITAHGIRVWWHLDRHLPWTAGVHDDLTQEARGYVIKAIAHHNAGLPLPPLPRTTDPIIPPDAYPGLLELDTATLLEGDPI